EEGRRNPLPGHVGDHEAQMLVVEPREIIKIAADLLRWNHACAQSDAGARRIAPAFLAAAADAVTWIRTLRIASRQDRLLHPPCRVQLPRENLSLTFEQDVLIFQKIPGRLILEMGVDARQKDGRAYRLGNVID